jgi:prolipoprotein diacylglyceryltransferase
MQYLAIIGFKIPIETFFSIIAFVALCILLVKELRKNFKFSISDYFWFLFAAVFGSLAGGRLWYFAINFKGPETFLKLFDLTVPGLVSYGMIFGGLLSILLFSYLRNRKTWQTYFSRYMDICALGCALFVFIYRMGCFHFGDVPGTRTNVAWALNPVNYGSHIPGILIHPTALYLSLSALLIFIFLHWYRQRQKIDGEIGVLFLILYSFNRFWIEFFRKISYIII